MCKDKDLMTIQEHDVSINTLIHSAISKLDGESANAAITAIERLVDLKMKVDDKEAERMFNEAFAAFQANCPQIKKTSSTKGASAGGSGFGYNYAELDEIQKTIAPHLYPLGLSFNWDSKLLEDKIQCTCFLRHKAGHLITSSFTAPVKDVGKMNEIQKHSAVLTYIKRQTLIEVLGLTTTEKDTDGVSPETIDEKQIANLKDKASILDVTAQAKFFKWLGVDDWKDIPKSNYDMAVKALERKREAQK